RIQGTLLRNDPTKVGSPIRLYPQRSPFPFLARRDEVSTIVATAKDASRLETFQTVRSRPGRGGSSCRYAGTLRQARRGPPGRNGCRVSSHTEALARRDD